MMEKSSGLLSSLSLLREDEVETVGARGARQAPVNSSRSFATHSPRSTIESVLSTNTWFCKLEKERNK